MARNPKSTAASTRDLFFLHSETRDRARILPSNPVVPIDDPARPFHDALDHLKLALLGPAPQGDDYATLAYSLHCINMRDDLDDFGDCSHHSLIDILGKCYKGPTSKAQAIISAWDFLTKMCDLPASRIYITCYAGDASSGLEADTNSRDICRNLLKEKQILDSTSEADYYSGKDDFGPCGPCTRILFYPSDNILLHSTVTINGKKFYELANIVEFNRSKDGTSRPLIVTASGINYECLVTIQQHKRNWYETDLMTSIFRDIHKYAGDGVQSYSGATGISDVVKAYRLSVDHLRIISCASAPESQLGERGREYFLKCVDKRAQFGYQKLKIEAHDYPKLVKDAVMKMVPIYSDLHIKERIEEIVETEMSIYKKTLEEIEHEEPLKSGKKKKIKDKEGTEKSRRPVVWHRTRAVKFMGRYTHIIHKDKNKGCTLVSLCNVLLLLGKISLESDISEVSDYYLLHLVQRCLLYHNENMKLQHNLERSSFQLEVLNVLPDLHGHLFMDVKFKSISDFVDSPQYALYEYLDVPLYHGWLIDPQDKELASAMCTASFFQHSVRVAEYKSLKELRVERKGDLEEIDEVNRAIKISLGLSDDGIKSHKDQVEIIERFVRGPQLTSHGLDCLQKELKEGEPGVLLWNDRFITLIKVQGALYFLVNDLSALGTRIVWELLEEVNQGGSFTDDNFSTVDSDLNITMLPITKKDKMKEKKKKYKERHSQLSSISEEKEEMIPEESPTFALPSIISREDEEKIPEENLDIETFGEAGGSQVGSPQPNDTQVGSPEPDVSLPCKRTYKIRQVDFFGLRTHIIHQEDNGPCCLIAICNTLLLKGVIRFEPYVTELSEEELLSLLQSVLEKTEKMQGEVLCYSDMQIQVRDVVPTLPNSVEINMCFNSIDGFEQTPEYMLFDYLGIILYHGWLPDEGFLRAVISAHSYKSLTQAISLPCLHNDMILKFLNGPTMTDYGLRCLRREIEENVPFVLFWNKHFLTLIKFKGELYTLATDAGYLESAGVWMTLNEVNGDGTLVDSNFNPINLVPGTPLEPATGHGEICLGQFRFPIDGDYSIARTNEMLSAGHRRFPAGPSRKTDNRRAPISSANYAGNGNGFFGCVSLGKFVELPMNHFSEKRIIFPNSTSMVVADTRKVGRIIATNILQHIIEAHEAKNSWCGSFNLGTIFILDGYRVIITSRFCENFSEDAMLNDYITFAEVVLPLFNVEGVGMPAFFGPLARSLRNFKAHSKFHHQLTRFWDFVRNHFALKSSMRRTMLFTGIYRARRSAPKHVRLRLKSILKSQILKADIRSIVGEKRDPTDWRKIVAESGHPLLRRVLRFGPDDLEKNDKSLVKNNAEKWKYGFYDRTVESASLFPRRATDHGTDMPKPVDGVELEQEEEANLPSDVDLLYCHYMEDVLSQVLEALYCSPRMNITVWLWLEEYFEEYSRSEEP